MIGSTCVIFGGTGFIGTHFAEHLLAKSLVEKVILADVNELDSSRKTPFIEQALQAELLEIQILDVRHPIPSEQMPCAVDLVVNLAAVHREPGHVAEEYFETNIKGAENICAWAEQVKCEKLIFTSSIAPYGPSEEEKDETSLPVPVTSYGASKLIAEKIHVAWQNKAILDRNLVIVRPGVVFGPGEGGNVSRLIKAVLGRYFFYMGNEGTRKAGTYVKELCHAMEWVLLRQEETGEKSSLFNMSMSPAPTIKNYVDTVCLVAGVERKVRKIPYNLLYMASYLIDFIASILKVSQPVGPVRVRKLIRSNNISPGYLTAEGYKYRYSLVQAFEDWKVSRPDEWSSLSLRGTRI